jgi:hypothetical protein
MLTFFQEFRSLSPRLSSPAQLTQLRPAIELLEKMLDPVQSLLPTYIIVAGKVFSVYFSFRFLSASFLSPFPSLSVLSDLLCLFFLSLFYLNPPDAFRSFPLSLLFPISGAHHHLFSLFFLRGGSLGPCAYALDLGALLLCHAQKEGETG